MRAHKVRSLYAEGPCRQCEEKHSHPFAISSSRSPASCHSLFPTTPICPPFPPLHFPPGAGPLHCHQPTNRCGAGPIPSRSAHIRLPHRPTEAQIDGAWGAGAWNGGWRAGSWIQSVGDSRPPRRWAQEPQGGAMSSSRGPFRLLCGGQVGPGWSGPEIGSEPTSPPPLREANIAPGPPWDTGRQPVRDPPFSRLPRWRGWGRGWGREAGL